METAPLLRRVLKTTTYILVFLWAALKTNAQCPTIADANPPAICNASGFTFSDLDAYATDQGNGIVWYSESSGGTFFGSNELVPAGTYYADDNSGTCGSRASVTVTFTVPFSGNLDGIYCSNENATVQTYIDEVLAPSIPSGGNVEVYYDIDLTNQANTTDIIPTGASNFFIVFVDNGACRSQIENGSTVVIAAPSDPTPIATQQFCADTNPTVGDLDSGTGNNHTWYSSLDGFGNPVPASALLLTTALASGTYYVQIDGVFCDSNPVAVTVFVDTPVDSGSSTILNFCGAALPSTPFNLFDELGGTPDTTGSWSGPLSTTNGHLGTVNISTLTVGTHLFNYAVPTGGTCPLQTSSVVITVYGTFTSGAPSINNPASHCQSFLPGSFDLFTLLDGYDAGGKWTQGTLSTDLEVTSPIDITSLTPGTYDYTYTQNVLPNPCAEESTTVQIIVLADPNAGTAINASFCETDLVANSPYDLFNALDGSQDNNSGTWEDGLGVTVTNPIDISSLTAAGSPYSYSYTVDNGTCFDIETITITVDVSPDSGTPVATFPEYCEGLAPSSLDLFDLLENEDQTGTWYSGLDNLGSTVTNPVDLSGFTAGTYNFTYDVDPIGACDDVLVTVSVTINPLPNTGTPLTPAFCENDLAANSPLDLFSQLTGEDAGGTWTDVSGTGALTGSNLDLTSLTTGLYSFTYDITDGNGCTNSSTLVVTINDAPESGTATPAAEFCLIDITAAQTVDLFDLLTGEDQTGSWSDDDTTGALAGSTVTIDGLAAGTYDFTYDVDAIGSCDDAFVTVSIIINDTPAPTATSSQNFCDTGTVSDLAATGTTIQWYDEATGGIALAGTTVLVDGETYYATQTDGTTGCESSTRTLVTATISQSPNSGNLSTTPITACTGDASIDLFAGLDGTQDAGGSWSDDDSTGALSGSVFNATAISVGNYQFTYTVTGTSPCVPVSTTITVTIEDTLNPGTDNTLNICSNDGITDLFTLLGGADTGGVWSPDLASGTGVFDPLVDASGTYVYTLSNSCGNFTSQVDVTVTQAPNAGADNTTLICVIDGVTDLFSFLGPNAQTGGVWSPVLSSGTGDFDPLIDTAGVYTYTVVATGPCSPNASAQITVTIDDSPAPTVVDANPSFCLVDNPTVADLNASITATGTVIWYDDASQTNVLDLTDTLVNGEDYYATQTNGSGCESSENVQITVAVNDTPTPTLADVTIDYCINDAPIINQLTLNITEYDELQDNVVWYDAVTNGNVVSSSDLIVHATTYYAALVNDITGCESSVRLAVTPDITACGDLVLPDGFSPNGDGVNDTFAVDNISILYPNFQIEIFNRYGNVVYKGNASTPLFDGKSNRSNAAIKGDLPVGVYYYIFTYNDGENKPEQGHLYLSR